MTEGKKFIVITVVLYLSSLISYYSQIKIIDIYGLDVKYHFDLYLSYLQIAITFVIVGLPNAISLVVSREKKIPRNINIFSIFCSFIASIILNFFYFDSGFFILFFVFIFIFISLFNDLNTGIMNSIGMFEYPRLWQLAGNITLLFFICINPIKYVYSANLDSSDYALIFILLPILPLYFSLNFSRKYKSRKNAYESVEIKYVLKYVNYIYLFSILSIFITKIPYINYAHYFDKYSLAQYTLSVSLSNFMVIPLNLLVLKLLSSNSEDKIKINIINAFTLFSIIVSAYLIYFFSSQFNIINYLTNINSTSILVSTYLVIATIALSSINLSIALRLQRNIKLFLILDVLLVFMIYVITQKFLIKFDDLSGYNYLIVCIVFVKILFQVHLLRDKNVFDCNS